MQLYLIRHAESENNARLPYQRVEDPSITAVGRLQADSLSRWLNTLPIDVLVTSPFRRALQTSRQILDDGRSLRSMVWHDVFECGGCFAGHGQTEIRPRPGLGRSLIQQELPTAQVDDTIGEAGWYVGRVKETDEETRVRAAAATRRFAETFGDSNVSVVAVLHADFIRTMLSHMLLGVADAHRFGPLRNTGITKVDLTDGGWRLDWLNSVSHLPPKLITGVEW